METPDIITQEVMIDLKTVNVESRVIHTPWRIVHEPLQLYYSYELWERMQQGQKMINFVNRLKRKYKDYEKPDIRVHSNILTRFM